MQDQYPIVICLVCLFMYQRIHIVALTWCARACVCARVSTDKSMRISVCMPVSMLVSGALVCVCIPCLYQFPCPCLWLCSCLHVIVLAIVLVATVVMVANMDAISQCPNHFESNRSSTGSTSLLVGLAFMVLVVCEPPFKIYKLPVEIYSFPFVILSPFHYLHTRCCKLRISFCNLQTPVRVHVYM